MTDPRLTKLIADFETYKQEQEAHRKSQYELSQANLKAIQELTKATSGLIEAWTFLRTLHKFAKWLSGLSIIAAVVAYFSAK